MADIQIAQKSALAQFGQRDEIREIGDRLQKLMPGGQPLTQPEALAVAQIAIAHGLDPFNGEVWGLKGNDRWYGVMVGIKGLRKLARLQAIKEGTTFWTEFVRVEPEKYNVSTPGAIAWECIIRDTVTMQAWGKSVNILTSSGVPYKEALEMLGKAPQIVGHGIAAPDERSKMGIHERAKKRAEASAIKQRFDVSFGAGVIEDAAADETLTGEIVEAQTVAVEPEQRQPRTEEQILSELY